MTKNQYLRQQLTTATAARAVNSSYFHAETYYRNGIITRREAQQMQREAMTISARLGPVDPPLHCPPWTARRNKPTRQRGVPH